LVGDLNWNEEKARIQREVPVDGIRLTFNRILVATWLRPEKTSGGIILTDQTKDEDRYQGASGLVLAMGPQAYVSDDTVTFTAEDVVSVGDWVFFRRSEGLKVDVCGWPCIVFERESGIKAVIERPDLVY
jgi:co-chaperonin GroES (HSP10)